MSNANSKPSSDYIRGYNDAINDAKKLLRGLNDYIVNNPGKWLDANGEYEQQLEKEVMEGRCF